MIKVKTLFISCISTLLLCTSSYAQTNINKKHDEKVVKVLIIGGIQTSGLWQELSSRFEKKTGYKTEVVDADIITRIAPKFRKGQADLITMHSADITTNLVSDGHGINMRPWARNDHVIIGPKSDPANIRGLSDGVEALRRIAQTKSNWIPYSGDHFSHDLWRMAKIKPRGEWVLKDDLKGGPRVLSQLAKRNAYMITGRMPHFTGKWEKNPNIEILVDKDITMKRPYIVMEANPARHPHVNHKGAKALSDFMLSKEFQEFLLTFDGTTDDKIPYFYPVWPTLATQ